MSKKSNKKSVGFDYETKGLKFEIDGAWDDGSLSLAKAARDMFSNQKSSDVYINSRIDAIDSYKDPTSDIPLEEIEKYKYIDRQENYWRNKHNDLAEAFKILTAYNIDIDYNELILRAREAARFRDEFTQASAALEQQYPYIERTRNYVFQDDNIDHDPITNRNFEALEHKRLYFSDKLGSVLKNRDKDANGYSFNSNGIAGRPLQATSSINYSKLAMAQIANAAKKVFK